MTFILLLLPPVLAMLLAFIVRPYRSFVGRANALLSLASLGAALGAIIAIVETRIAKLRLFRVPELLAVSFVLALLGVTSSFLLR